MNSIPPEIHGQKYVSLVSFRKSGQPVATPIWFAELDGKLYVKTRGDSAKVKRIRNNPRVRVAPCTIRGRVTGPEFNGSARLLPQSDWPSAQKAMNRKYWLAWLPIWSKNNIFIEISV